MEKKKTKKRHNSFWSIFKFWGNNHNFLGRSSGFTLVELLTVVGIIGILITGALITLNPAAQIAKTNDAKRKADLAQMQKALEVYYQDNGKYPLVASYKMVRLDNSTADWGTQFTPYISVLPKDPRPNQRTYVYFTSSNRQSYWIYASLEKDNDPAFCNSGNPCISLTSNGIPQASCIQICNFGVSSSNTSP